MDNRLTDDDASSTRRSGNCESHTNQSAYPRDSFVTNHAFSGIKHEGTVTTLAGITTSMAHDKGCFIPGFTKDSVPQNPSAALWLEHLHQEAIQS